MLYLVLQAPLLKKWKGSSPSPVSPIESVKVITSFPTLSNKVVEKVEAHANNNNQLHNICLPKWLHLNC